jgi:transposase-like protein
MYPIVFFDAIHYKVRDDSKKVISKAAYTCLGVELTGKKDLLGLWIGEAEGANFWLSVTELYFSFGENSSNNCSIISSVSFIL